MTREDAEKVAAVVNSPLRTGPDVMIASGAVLNELTGTNNYDPQARYIVSDKGTTLLPERIDQSW